MKRIFIKGTALLIAVMAVIMSFGGCFDIDELVIDLGLYRNKEKVNKKVNVLFRECHGVTCLDEKHQKTVEKGEDVKFLVMLDEDYIYLGNSADAEYLPQNNGMAIVALRDVKAPLTVDMYVEHKRNLYYVDIAENQEDVRVIIQYGSIWSQEPHKIKLEAELNEYKLICWSVGAKYIPGQPNPKAKVLSTNPVFTYDVNTNGIHTLYLNVVAASQYTPDMVPPVDA